eukprot:m.202892 g.202892  ORF g.202892 m.202892 type:complete len:1094 (+) comp13725_c1_seq4:1162-4443(+)
MFRFFPWEKDARKYLRILNAFLSSRSVLSEHERALSSGGAYLHMFLMLFANKRCNPNDFNKVFKDYNITDVIENVYSHGLDRLPSSMAELEEEVKALDMERVRLIAVLLSQLRPVEKVHVLKSKKNIVGAMFHVIRTHMTSSLSFQRTQLPVIGVYRGLFYALIGYVDILTQRVPPASTYLSRGTVPPPTTDITPTSPSPAVNHGRTTTQEQMKTGGGKANVCTWVDPESMRETLYHDYLSCDGLSLLGGSLSTVKEGYEEAKAKGDVKDIATTRKHSSSHPLPSGFHGQQHGIVSRHRRSMSQTDDEEPQTDARERGSSMSFSDRISHLFSSSSSNTTTATTSSSSTASKSNDNNGRSDRKRTKSEEGNVDVTVVPLAEFVLVVAGMLGEQLAPHFSKIRDNITTLKKAHKAHTLNAQNRAKEEVDDMRKTRQGPTTTSTTTTTSTAIGTQGRDGDTSSTTPTGTTAADDDEPTDEDIAFRVQSTQRFDGLERAAKVVVLQLLTHFDPHRVALLTKFIREVSGVVSSMIAYRLLGALPYFFHDTVANTLAAVCVRGVGVAPFSSSSSYMLQTNDRRALFEDGLVAVCGVLACDQATLPDVQSNTPVLLRAILDDSKLADVLLQSPRLLKQYLLGVMTRFVSNDWVSCYGLLLVICGPFGFGGALSRYPHRPDFFVAQMDVERPSGCVREVWAQLATEHRKTVETFLNALLNHANWTAGELWQVMDDLYGDAPQNNSTEETSTAEKTTKAQILFAIATHLLRILERIVTDAVEFFSDIDIGTVLRTTKHSRRTSARNSRRNSITGSRQRETATTTATAVLPSSPLTATTATIPMSPTAVTGDLNVTRTPSSAVYEERYSAKLEAIRSNNTVRMIRAAEIFVHVINRLLVAHTYTDKFGKALLFSECLPMSMVSPCIGALITLANISSRCVARLAEDPSFTEEHLNAMKTAINNMDEKVVVFTQEEQLKLYTFANKMTTKFGEEKEKMAEMMKKQNELSKRRSLGEEPESDDDDDNLCPICYAADNAVRFIPCKHESCRLCISRHLQNSEKCFFCNAIVERLEEIHDDGEEGEEEADGDVFGGEKAQNPTNSAV